MIPLLLLLAQSADPDFYSRGIEAAQAESLGVAREQFLEGFTRFPRDARFPVELAGIAYREKRYPEARRYLHTALSLDPANTYAADFLGTLYYLDSSYEAAIK